MTKTFGTITERARKLGIMTCYRIDFGGESYKDYAIIEADNPEDAERAATQYLGYPEYGNPGCWFRHPWRAVELDARTFRVSSSCGLDI